jgi:hypothetical protein
MNVNSTNVNSKQLEDKIDSLSTQATTEQDAEARHTEIVCLLTNMNTNLQIMNRYLSLIVGDELTDEDLNDDNY